MMSLFPYAACIARRQANASPGGGALLLLLQGGRRLLRPGGMQLLGTTPAASASVSNTPSKPADSASVGTSSACGQATTARDGAPSQRPSNSSTSSQAADSTPPHDSNGSSSNGKPAGEQASDAASEAADAGVGRLHPGLVSFLNGAYLTSAHELRRRLMNEDWGKHQALWAARKGLAEFARWSVENDREAPVSWEMLQQLFEPLDARGDLEAALRLDALAHDPRRRVRAYAFMMSALADGWMSAFKMSDATARELANVMDATSRTGAGAVMAFVRRLLPWPFR